MVCGKEKILGLLCDRIAAMDEVKAIGMSGSKTPLPQAGEGDIDIFIYCDEIPDVKRRQALINEMGELLQDGKINVFEGGHWGTGDFVLINGVETWLMYFTLKESIEDVEAILSGTFPDKLDNYYYPIGRCAMLKGINILYDKACFLAELKNRLTQYPDDLSKLLTQYHMEELEDIEDLERAVTRKDVLFYHFALDLAMDHFLQALFALNKTYFPSRKRSMEYIKTFIMKPEHCEDKLLDVIKLGGCSENIEESYTIWRQLVQELKNLRNV